MLKLRFLSVKALRLFYNILYKRGRKYLFLTEAMKSYYCSRCANYTTSCINLACVSRRTVTPFLYD